jgi:TonB-linked SusC/RagA family outer membrane protein
MRRASLLCVLGVLFGMAPLYAQTGTTGRILGSVTEATTARPLSGATVSVVGTNIGTLSGPDGRFVLAAVPAGTHQVRVSMFGYGSRTESITVTAGEASTANFQLSTEAVVLEGVVAVGYGTQQRRDVVGSVASVRQEEIARVPTPNPMQAIQGRIPGVDIMTTNQQPGAGMNVRIRGVRSMRASNEPLYVVDGIPISGGIEDFNPANIQSVEVLKDAAATAIYGSRGANGVILITTREGRPGQTRITYDTYVGAQRPVQLAPMMDGPTWAQMKREAFWTVDDRDSRPRRSDAEIFNEKELWSIQTGEWVDWQREILRTGIQQNHQVGVSGATENTRFSLSGNFYDHRGITLGQGYDRYSGAVSLDHTVGRLRVGMSANMSRSTQNIGKGDGLWGEALANAPLGRVRDDDGLLVFKPNDDPLRVNPLFEVEEWRRERTRNRLFGAIFSELQLAEGLSWRVNFGPDLSDRLDGQFRGPHTTARNLALGDAYRDEEETFGYTLDNLLNFNRNIGGVHRFDVTGLYSIQEERYERTRATATNLPFSTALWYNLGVAPDRDVTSNLSRWALESYMGRVNYSLLDRYLLTVTGRYDGSSRLAEGNKWSFFPSVGLGWHLGDEAFVRDLGWFTDLKLRGSYGVTGNTAIPVYGTQGRLERTRYSFGNDVPALGYRPATISNPDLAWERTTQYNVGADWGILRNRVTGSVDLYQQDTDDLLMDRSIPATSGFGSTLQNIGATRNKGFELALSTVNVDGWNGLRWSSDVNFTANRNEIVRLASGLDADIVNGWFVGRPINVGGANQNLQDRFRRVYYDYEFAGIWQLHERELAATFGQQPGDIRVVDQNGDGRISADDDRVILGNTYPRWIGSLNNRLDWNGFDFSILAAARIGYTFFDSFATSTDQLYARFGNLDTNYWTPENPSNTSPRPSAGREGPLYNNSRGYVDGSHWRIRNISLGYSIPPTVLGRFGANSMRIYATAQEPFIFTDYVGYDPEGGHFGTPPTARTLLIGTNVSF